MIVKMYNGYVITWKCHYYQSQNSHSESWTHDPSLSRIDISPSIMFTMMLMSWTQLYMWHKAEYGFHSRIKSKNHMQLFRPGVTNLFETTSYILCIDQCEELLVW